jgi:hypothetical protein
MKKKYLLIVALVAVLGTMFSGCYVQRGYYHPYHHGYYYR